MCMNTEKTNMHAQQMLHYSLYMKSNKVTYSLSQLLEHLIAIASINSASLKGKSCYLAFTHLCTAAIVLKQEQMVIIISINNNFFPFCSNEVQLNKYSLKLYS